MTLARNDALASGPRTAGTVDDNMFLSLAFLAILWQ
jgi:hypothetical protein